MRKALLPMIASLALCGAATAALIATNARAEPERPQARDAGAGRARMRSRPAHRRRLRPKAAAAGHDARSTADCAAQQMCQDMYAHKVGELAYLEAKLSLTAGQQPLFDHWKQAKPGHRQAAAKRDCSHAMKPRTSPASAPAWSTD